MGEAVFAYPKAADDLPDTIKIITEEKKYLPEEVFNADENAIFWIKNHKRHLLVRKRSESQDLRQKEID